MANCLEPDCPNSALTGSDFCGTHALRGKQVIYVKDSQSFPGMHVGLSDPFCDEDPDFILVEDIEIEDDE